MSVFEEALGKGALEMKDMLDLAYFSKSHSRQLKAAMLQQRRKLRQSSGGSSTCGIVASEKKRLRSSSPPKTGSALALQLQCPE